jgi:hypothetical protein
MKLDGYMMTKNKFTKIVEDLVKEKQLSYLEAIVYFCEENTIDVEDVRKYISDPIKGKIEVEAMNLNYLPKQNQLSFS